MPKKPCNSSSEKRLMENQVPGINGALQSGNPMLCVKATKVLAFTFQITEISCFQVSTCGKCYNLSLCRAGAR